MITIFSFVVVVFFNNRHILSYLVYLNEIPFYERYFRLLAAFSARNLNVSNNDPGLEKIFPS